MKNFIVFIVFLIMSCGAKTSNKKDVTTKEVEDKKETVEVNTSVKEDTSIKFEGNVNSSTESTDKSSEAGLEIVPIDHTNTSSYTDSKGNTTVFKNAKIKTRYIYKDVFIKDTISEQNLINVERELEITKDSLISKEAKILNLKQEAEKNKVVEQFNWSKFIWQLWWLWLLLALLIYIVVRWNKLSNPFTHIPTIFSNSDKNENI
jgi:hypothetical protein